MAEADWDDTKSAKCLAERGFDFSFASRIFDGEIVEFVDDRFDYGEIRRIALGFVDGRSVAVGYTWRGDLRWIFTAFRCDREEEVRRWQRHTAANR